MVFKWNLNFFYCRSSFEVCIFRNKRQTMPLLNMFDLCWLIPLFSLLWYIFYFSLINPPISVAASITHAISPCSLRLHPVLPQSWQVIEGWLRGSVFHVETADRNFKNLPLSLRWNNSNAWVQNNKHEDVLGFSYWTTCKSEESFVLVFKVLRANIHRSSAHKEDIVF